MMPTLYTVPSNANLNDLQDTLVHLSLEVGRRVGCPTKQSLSATIEYRLTAFTNCAFGYQVMQPVTGCHGADAEWITEGAVETVEQKATEITNVTTDRGHGRIYTSSSFSFLDWPAQLIKRDRVMLGMHDSSLNIVAALIVPRIGVNAMFNHAVSTYGMPTPRSGNRPKATFSLKTVLEIAPTDNMVYLLHEQRVQRYQFVEAFFGRTDQMYLNLFW